MAFLGIILGYLLLGVVIAYLGAARPRAWQRVAAVVLAASLPLLAWLILSVKDSLVFDRPVFDLESESGRFGFYVGLILAAVATPVWLLAGLLGAWLGRRRASGAVDTAQGGPPPLA
ncbi:MAG TPA: hypothetical protein VNH53_11830 [Sphingomicrobium sp.]|jgi:cytochrome c biogenesis protein CcdA|nr:hypothetical protein [Sphingomicrobium sp.]